VNDAFGHAKTLHQGSTRASQVMALPPSLSYRIPPITNLSQSDTACAEFRINSVRHVKSAWSLLVTN